MKTPSTDVERELLWTLRDLVAQHCVDDFKAKDLELKYDDPTPLFSGFVRANAQAIRILGEYGLVTIDGDNGDRVIQGTLASPNKTAQTIKTGIYIKTA